MVVHALGSVAVRVFSQLGIGYGIIFQIYALFVLLLVVAMTGLARLNAVPTRD